ncbi:hypothetical protein Q4F19_17545 [Sphingomonas sp. BIUV-7]|uniref:Uncharacterized protein n=1 Tax=Sphingomonas natans TaxID=3063330 RepID=A0ABT8YCV2_9SPHN|nr:hypothetical protein [Sphingomonas sp. BIUV-7]MDO6416195.1 hypothetical protein [Sphingomonas sp. BIUV-7]
MEFLSESCHQRAIAAVQRGEIARRMIGLHAEAGDGFVPRIQPIERADDRLDMDGASGPGHCGQRIEDESQHAIMLPYPLGHEPFVESWRKA